jgi:hypothetical protein
MRYLAFPALNIRIINISSLIHIYVCADVLPQVLYI